MTAAKQELFYLDDGSGEERFAVYTNTSTSHTDLDAISRAIANNRASHRKYDEIMESGIIGWSGPLPEPLPVQPHNRRAKPATPSR